MEYDSVTGTPTCNTRPDKILDIPWDTNSLSSEKSSTLNLVAMGGINGADIMMARMDPEIICGEA